MSLPKLLFVYEHKKPEWWLDGLSHALDCLETDFEITKLNLNDGGILSIPFQDFDFVLGWGGFESKVDKFMQTTLCKKGLCLAGNAFGYTDQKYDIIFYETNWVREFLNLSSLPCKVVKAFGVNTDIYNDVDFMTPLVFDYLGVGALAKWKRWEKMKDKKGIRMVIGEYQTENEIESADIACDLLRHGVMVSNMVHPFDLANIYHWASTLYVPADIYGGGERTILEARACNLKIEIEDDNPKLKELLYCDIPSHLDYAKKLKDGIMSVL